MPSLHGDVWPSIPKSDPPPPYAHITATSGRTIDLLGRAVRDALQDAMAMRGRLRDDAFKVQGYSGKKFRLLLNNLISEVADPCYLDIGLFHGASICSALFRNRLRAVCIDNWSAYGGQRHLFTANPDRFLTEQTSVEIIARDFRKVGYGPIGTFNILFDDGPHNEKDQYASMTA